MKKIYLLLWIFIHATITSKATTYTVNVSDNIFSPDNFTVVAGDTITWMWINGNHTTTSTVVPLGALPWNASINQNSQVFSYVPTMTGNYDYQCNFHYMMGMIGHFSVMGSAGIEEIQSGILLNVIKNPATNQLHVNLNTTEKGMYEMTLNDITGRVVKTLFSAQQSQGEHHYYYNVADLAKGMYLLKLSGAGTEVVKKVIIE